MPGHPFDPDDVGRDPIDDRWTSQKLAEHGYVFVNERCCTLCGTELAVYEQPATARHSRRWLFLDTATLEPHEC